MMKQKNTAIVLAFLFLAIALGMVSCDKGGSELHNHKYDQANESASFLKAEATCSSNALFYYSCVCGEKGQETFDSGNVDPLNHAGQTRTNYERIDGASHSENIVCDECNSVISSITQEHNRDAQDYCVTCGDHEHSYIEKNTEAKYLKSSADCSHSAIYYYSCACGAKGTAVFEVEPENKVENHFGGTKIAFERIDENTHRKITICLGCGEIRNSVVSSHEDDCDVCFCPGLYNENDQLLATWETLTSVYGMNIGKDYSCKCSIISGHEECKSAPRSVFSSKELVSGTKLIIDWNETSIGSYAFVGCEQLTKIVIPEGIFKIGAHAFDGCVNLASVILPESLKSIGNYAFYNCDSLKRIGIPQKVESIGDYSFAECERLTSVDFDSVYYKGILNATFYNCPSLKNIFYVGTMEDWSNIRVYSIIPAGNNNKIYWYTNTGEFAVHCSNGSINKVAIAHPYQ